MSWQKAKKSRVNNTDASEKGCLGNTKQLKFTFVCSVKRGRKKVSSIRYSTFDTDSNMQTMITELQDIYLFVGIDGRDLIAIEAKYYLKYLATIHLYRKL